MSALHLMALCRPFLMLAGVTPTRLLTQRKSGIRTGRQAPTAFACTVTPEPDEVGRPDWRQAAGTQTCGKAAWQCSHTPPAGIPWCMLTNWPQPHMPKNHGSGSRAA